MGNWAYALWNIHSPLPELIQSVAIEEGIPTQSWRGSSQAAPQRFKMTFCKTFGGWIDG